MSATRLMIKSDKRSPNYKLARNYKRALKGVMGAYTWKDWGKIEAMTRQNMMLKMKELKPLAA